LHSGSRNMCLRNEPNGECMNIFILEYQQGGRGGGLLWTVKRIDPKLIPNITRHAVENKRDRSIRTDMTANSTWNRSNQIEDEELKNSRGISFELQMFHGRISTCVQKEIALYKENGWSLSKGLICCDFKSMAALCRTQVGQLDTEKASHDDTVIKFKPPPPSKSRLFGYNLALLYAKQPKAYFCFSV